MIGPHDELVRDTREGGITLVLGAGVSRSIGMCDWKTLAEAVGRACGVWPTLSDEDVADVPQFLPFVFELAHERLGSTERFIAVLREHLYSDAQPPDDAELLRASCSTLAVVARTIWGELQGPGKGRIDRVVTFNVDDMVERAVQCLAAGSDSDVMQVVARANDHPVHGVGDLPLPVYHLHGYLPFVRQETWHQAASDTLVFMDAQYWASGANPLSFANRVVATALHDSHCLFIGCSMSDINILRWLGLRFNELLQDKRQQYLQHHFAPEGDEETLRTQLRQALRRHYWIRGERGSMADFVSSCLDLRGVRTVPVDGWNTPSFAKLMTDCFPPNESPGQD